MASLCLILRSTAGHVASLHHPELHCIKTLAQSLCTASDPLTCGVQVALFAVGMDTRERVKDLQHNQNACLAAMLDNQNRCL